MSAEETPTPVPAAAPAGEEPLSKNALKKKLKAEKAAAAKAAKAKEKVSLVITGCLSILQISHIAILYIISSLLCSHEE